MSQTFEFYDARANEAASEAAEATLENVKDRNLRAEKTWRGLADQAKRVSLERQKALREREARDRAEKDALGQE
ncbi:hypothetical protein E3U23_05600 [Erythrobacter litoralis]|uniref:hypothetical protein n=1 Tax=Erythrobacter litoralis TaxID=39960 RepID=UPI002435399C|nr:hypothetical protein [Erythrobacter litoralis]MDG6078667.1 hypothetical protein [Erythrobacter litoralis]